ncbi:hypothetical protein CSV77_14525 [Sporosarcina sp. P16b]|nr:hypothetical protein CSV77_14525 [Sporosarcina sp. P16b]
MIKNDTIYGIPKLYFFNLKPSTAIGRGFLLLKGKNFTRSNESKDKFKTNNMVKVAVYLILDK